MKRKYFPENINENFLIRLIKGDKQRIKRTPHTYKYNIQFYKKLDDVSCLTFMENLVYDDFFKAILYVYFSKIEYKLSDFISPKLIHTFSIIKQYCPEYSKPFNEYKSMLENNTYNKYMLEIANYFKEYYVKVDISIEFDKYKDYDIIFIY